MVKNAKSPYKFTHADQVEVKITTQYKRVFEGLAAKTVGGLKKEDILRKDQPGEAAAERRAKGIGGYTYVSKKRSRNMMKMAKDPRGYTYHLTQARARGLDKFTWNNKTYVRKEMDMGYKKDGGKRAPFIYYKLASGVRHLRFN